LVPGVLLALSLGCTAAWSTNYPVTAEQRQTAERVAQAGVPLEALAPDAPESYTVKRGDTL
jgi:nucleoid-associated protein YgaU